LQQQLFEREPYQEAEIAVRRQPAATRHAPPPSAAPAAPAPGATEEYPHQKTFSQNTGPQYNFSQNNYAQNNYAQSNYAQNNYAQNNFSQDNFPRNDIPEYQAHSYQPPAPTQDPPQPYHASALQQPPPQVISTICMFRKIKSEQADAHSEGLREGEGQGREKLGVRTRGGGIEETEMASGSETHASTHRQPPHTTHGDSGAGNNLSYSEQRQYHCWNAIPRRLPVQCR